MRYLVNPATRSYVTRTESVKEKIIVSAKGQGSVYRHAFERIVNTRNPDSLLVTFAKCGLKLYYDPRTVIDMMWDHMLEHMPSVKELEIYITEAYEGPNDGSGGKVHPQIQTLTLHSGDDEVIEILLNLYQDYNMFPNLTCLYLRYFGGVYDDDEEKFKIGLSEYKLEKLSSTSQLQDMKQ